AGAGLVRLALLVLHVEPIDTDRGRAEALRLQRVLLRAHHLLLHLDAADADLFEGFLDQGARLVVVAAALGQDELHFHRRSSLFPRLSVPRTGLCGKSRGLKGPRWMPVRARPRGHAAGSSLASSGGTSGASVSCSLTRR